MEHYLILLEVEVLELFIVPSSYWNYSGAIYCSIRSCSTHWLYSVTSYYWPMEHLWSYLLFSQVMSHRLVVFISKPCSKHSCPIKHCSLSHGVVEIILELFIVFLRQMAQPQVSSILALSTSLVEIIYICRRIVWSMDDHLISFILAYTGPLNFT